MDSVQCLGNGCADHGKAIVGLPKRRQTKAISSDSQRSQSVLPHENKLERGRLIGVTSNENRLMHKSSLKPNPSPHNALQTMNFASVTSKLKEPDQLYCAHMAQDELCPKNAHTGVAKRNHSCSRLLAQKVNVVSTRDEGLHGLLEDMHLLVEEDHVVGLEL